MKIFTLGGGFVSDHLPYDKILDRIHPHEEDIDYVLTKYKPDVIINCIGKTGRPNVDWCETHKSETYMSNVVLPAMVAAQCETAGIHFIQIGSGCIYFGESPSFHYLQGDGTPWPDRNEGVFIIPGIKVDNGWKETDFANPKSFYSKTKYACDLLLGAMPNVTTLRIRMPISTKNNQRNLINKLAGYKQVIDIPNSVTFMDDLTRCVDWVAKGGRMGIYHVTNPEPLTAAQVMREYQKYMPKHTFEIINEQQLDSLTVAKRSNCIIDASKLNAAGFQMTPSKKALEKCMSDYFGRMYV
jgi:dTDP-4-dehydrorhamnose reductase